MKRRSLAAFMLLLVACTVAGSPQDKVVASDLPNAPSATKSAVQSQSPGSHTARVAANSSVQEAWPKEVKSGEYTFTVFQPQLDSWDADMIEARAAVAVTTATNPRITYGVLWLSAHTQVDKNSRMVTLTDLVIKKARFPAAPEQETAYLTRIRESVVSKVRLMALDRLEALVAILQAEKAAAAVAVNNDPPTIVFSQSPALLVYVDGDPVYRPMKNIALQRLINTRCLILRDPDGKHYLHLMDGWMESPALAGPWTVAQRVSPDMTKAEKDAVASGQVDMLSGRADPKKPGPSLAKIPAPAIYVATSPTELIVTEGEPKFVDIAGTQLQYVQNTTGHVFRNLAENKIYVLISGRWFAADSLEGPWHYVPGGQLPSDFAKISDESPKENVKASIPGTPQALEALIANTIPQTATVNRKESKMAPPRFDGEPQWKPIEETLLQYATNTSWPIIKVKENLLYAVENAIWFKAESVGGPWEVADSVPAEIYSIPPSSPLHNITYIKIYRSTSDSISVGYTNGYYGTCVSQGSGPVVVYGTGYRYTPWIGAVWYGAPLTYGYGSGLTFTPWTGWTYGFGFGLAAPTSSASGTSSKAGPPASSNDASVSASGTTPSSLPAEPVASFPSSGETAASASTSSDVTISFMYGAYPWWGPYAWGYYYPYPYYYPPYYYPVYGAAWGPYGAAAWGPGGWAATTGNVYQRWGNTGAVTRTSGGYNAWTGNAWARQVGASYNSRTGTLAAGQRGYVANAYTGNYAYGGRGAAYNPNTGRGATAGRYTAGNAETGQSTTAGWIRTNQGGVARVGDDVYGAHDGTVYRKTDSGWESNSGSGWQSAERGSAQQQRDNTQQRSQPTLQAESRQSLDRQYSARQSGSQRTQNFNSGSFRSAGMRRGGGRRR